MTKHILLSIVNFPKNGKDNYSATLSIDGKGYEIATSKDLDFLRSSMYITILDLIKDFSDKGFNSLISEI